LGDIARALCPSVQYAKVPSLLTACQCKDQRIMPNAICGFTEDFASIREVSNLLGWCRHNRFAIGVRNANNKRFRLACTVGLRVFVCHNLAFRGDFSPVLVKHSKHLLLEDTLSIGVDRMQRNFESMRQQVESWRAQQLSAGAAKLTIYRAFVEGELDVPKHLARKVHDLYFNPQHEEFQPRTMWSLSNAFTSAFKELDPIPQFRATACR